MIMVTKRDGKKVQFSKKKIIDAILEAFNAIDNDVSEYALEKANHIADYVENYCVENNKNLSVEEIQDLVEKGLMSTKRKDVAKAYITYRHERDVIRTRNSVLRKKVMEKLMATNVQNQNANVDEYSFGGRMGEASDEQARDVALNDIISPMARENHLNNLIYIHDLNSYAVGSHNCFEKNTSFITSKGIKAFKDFNENDIITVLSPNGTWVTGIVKKYGVQPVNTYVFKRNKTEIKIKATSNHRWLMEDGSFQEGLKIGDKLFDSPYFWQDFDFQTLSKEGKKYWCYGFVMGDGTLETRYSKRLKKYYKPGTTKVKLCGEKIKYLPYFQDCGWGLGCISKEPEVSGIPFDKTFPDFEVLPLEYLIAFIHGLYDADGTKALAANTGKQIYSIQFSDKTYCDFVEKYFEVAGLYINSIKDKTGQKTNFGIRKYTKNYQFTAESSSKYHWYVKNILYKKENTDVWCLEVEEGHAFTLAGGIPTGNCLSVPFDKLLAKGFNTRQTDVRPAQSVSTAFQLVAVIFQLQSLQQFGGVSATHLDWTMVPYVRKSFYKHYVDGLKYINEPLNPLYKEFTEKMNNTTPINKYTDVAPKAYQYAMDMTTKEVYQAVEGLYHNLNTLQSRSGNQLPFTSINYGTCTLPEGRLVIKALLDVSIKGIGKLHKTSIFPCGIFQCMNGVNRKKGDPNYDLFQLALQSTAKRLYPNYANVDWSGNAGYDRDDPRTYFSTMGKRKLSSSKIF